MTWRNVHSARPVIVRLRFLMTGTFRFLLAALVMVGHIAGYHYLKHFGQYAVRAFFVLSGFAVTTALNGVYCFAPVQFFGNRFLRLFPCYFAACAGTAIAIQAYPLEAAAFMPRWAFDALAGDIARNFLIVPLAFGEPAFRYIEPAWSIAVELVLYLLLWIGIARSARAASIALAAGIAYHATMLLAGAPFEYRYFSINSAVFSFSAGSLLHFALQNGRFAPGPGLGALAGTLWIANLVTADWIMPARYTETWGFYLNTALAAVIVSALAAAKKRPALAAIDRVLGELAYPVFLLQWIAAFVTHVVFARDTWRGWDLVVDTTPVILAMAACLAWAQSALVEPLRRHVRLTASADVHPTLAQSGVSVANMAD
jgi:peptidoglycan/LPS O-acetylase OafA/YrhL